MSKPKLTQVEIDLLRELFDDRLGELIGEAVSIAQTTNQNLWPYGALAEISVIKQLVGILNFTFDLGCGCLFGKDRIKEIADEWSVALGEVK